MAEDTTQSGREREGARRYANAVEVDFTLAEFTLDFVQCFGPDAPAPRQCRLVTSPLNMPRFRDAIADALADYERRYGALPVRREREG